MAAGTAAADPVEPTTPPSGTSTVMPTEPPAGEPAQPPTETSTETSSEAEAPPSGPASSSGEATPDAPGGDEQKSARIDLLEVSATFDKPSYRTGETMTIHFTVTNPQPVRVEHIQVSYGLSSPDDIRTDYESWGPLNTGATIEAGGTLGVDVTGRAGNPDTTTGVLDGFLYDESGAGIAEFHLTTPVTPSFSHASGTVYADANDNAAYDDGEGLAGAVVRMSNSDFDQAPPVEATTGANGAFTFPRVPTVRMFVTATAPDGWLVGYDFVSIDEDGVDDLRLRAVRPLTNLEADLAFTKDSYRAGEVAKVKVTLTNSGTTPVVGIFANCNRVGASNGLTGTGPGWGDLSFVDGAGVRIGAKKSRTLTVTEVVPRAAQDYGAVHVACDFSYRNVDDSRNPEASDSAKVPGGFGDVTGSVEHFPNGQENPGVGIGGVRLVMVTDARCPIVAETRTDADGDFDFRHLPSGPYRMFVFPPAGWHVPDNPVSVDVMTGGVPDFRLEAVPGDAQAPALPTQPADCGTSTSPAAAQGGSAPAHAADSTGLASTGASVLGLLVAGTGVLAAGAGSVLTARRRSGI